MCVALVTLAGKVIPNDQLYRGWTTNSDGAGFAYIDNRQVKIKKGFMNYNEFQKAYAIHAERYGKDNPMLVHMRIATSGGTNRRNTHPFPIRNGALIHNGVMFTPHGPQAGKGDSTNSDTAVLAQTVHNIFTKEDVKAAKEALGRAIGSGNKIAVLWDDGDFEIINDTSGWWKDGIWYSNGTCGVYRG